MIITVSLLLALFIASVTYTEKIAGLGNSTTASLLLQTTPTRQVEKDQSEVGSTDGIVIAGGVISLIILIPILIEQRSWMRAE